MTWMLSIAQDSGAPTGIRVVMAVAHLSATGTKATPAEVGRLLGIERSAANHALRRAAKGIEGVSNDGGFYSVKGVGVTDTSLRMSDVSVTVDDGNVTAPMTETSLSDDGNVTGTVVDSRAHGSSFSLIPTVSSEVDAQAPASTREAVDESKASSWPTSTTTTYPEGFAEVIEAWNGLRTPKGEPYGNQQIKSPDLLTLRRCTADFGSTLIIETIAAIQRYITSKPYFGTPGTHWIRRRAEELKAGANRPNSQARKTRGGGDELIGSVTPEQRAVARAQTVDPELIKRLEAERAKRFAATVRQFEERAQS